MHTHSFGCNPFMHELSVVSQLGVRILLPSVFYSSSELHYELITGCLQLWKKLVKQKAKLDERCRDNFAICTPLTLESQIFDSLAWGCHQRISHGGCVPIQRLDPTLFTIFGQILHKHCCTISCVSSKCRQETQPFLLHLENKTSISQMHDSFEVTEVRPSHVGRRLRLTLAFYEDIHILMQHCYFISHYAHSN